jgi:predicted Zn-dependent protease with MMP-like domain
MFDTLTEAEWDRVDDVWDLMESADFDKARVAVDGLIHTRGRHPDLALLDCALAIEEGRAEYALQGLTDAESSADPALFFEVRALARFHLVEPETAREDAEKALAIRPHMAEAHALLAKIHDFLGNAGPASEHAETAFELDPEGFPMSLEMEDEAFDALVEASLRELPERVREHLQEIPVLVEPMPQRDLLTSERPPLPPDILGLFVGRHLMERTHADLPDSPGAIYLFRRNLLRIAADREELSREVRVTVQHEVGHLLGLDEDDLDAWGLA